MKLTKFGTITKENGHIKINDFSFVGDGKLPSDEAALSLVIEELQTELNKLRKQRESYTSG